MPHPSSRDAAVTPAPRRDVTASSTPSPWGVSTSPGPQHPTNPLPFVTEHTLDCFQHSAATPPGRRKVGGSQPGAAPLEPEALAVGADRGSDAKGTAGAASITPVRSQA